MVAAGVRNIKPGTEYNKFFGNPERKDPYWPHGSVYDTLELMQKVVNLTIDQTKAIAKHLAGPNLDQTCKNIWSFLYNHIQYKEDLRNVEQLRSPNRAWADRKTGVDCDCFSIFISSILTNLRIPHALRITEYDGKGYFQHVFVIVPIGPIDYSHGTFKDRKTYLVIDPVVDQYNYEKPFTNKHDKIMAIKHQFLNGVGSVAFGAEFDHLNGLGNATTDDVNESMRVHLENTLKIAKANPRTVMNVVDPQVFIAQLTYLLNNWSNPIARMAALEELEEMEDRGETSPKGTVSGLGCACRTKITPSMPKAVALKKVAILAERRKANPVVMPLTYQRGNTVNNPKLHSLCQAYAGSPSMNGLNGKFFSKLKTAVKNTTTKVKAVAQKVGDKIKVAAKAIVQQNPVTISIRGGVLLAMKSNVFKIAERLKFGYLTEAEAKARGFEITEWKKLKASLDNAISTFQKLGGKPENLKNAILSGKAGGLNGAGLGVVAAAGLMAAASAVIAKITGALKNINNSKLFEKVKGGIAKAKELIASKLPGSEAEVTSMVQSDPTVTDEFTQEMQTKAAEVDTATAFTTDTTSDSKTRSSTDPNAEPGWFEKNWKWAVPVAAVAVTVGTIAVVKFSSKKSLKGIIPAENLKGAKHASI